MEVPHLTSVAPSGQNTISPQFSPVLPSLPIPHWQPQMGRYPLRRKRRRQRHRSPSLRGIHRRKRLFDVTSNLIQSQVWERTMRTWALLCRQPEAPCRSESPWHRHQIGDVLLVVPSVEFCFLTIGRLREDDVEPLQVIIWLGQFCSRSRIEAPCAINLECCPADFPCRVCRRSAAVTSGNRSRSSARAVTDQAHADSTWGNGASVNWRSRVSRRRGARLHSTPTTQ
jgi:hypothetical protein